MEREIAAQNDAFDIVRRARERAIKAVNASSLGVEHARLEDALQTATRTFESSEPVTLVRSEETRKWADPVSCIVDRCSEAEENRRWAEINRRMEAYYAAKEQFDREMRDMRTAKEAAYDRMERLVDLMTDIFIEDEIDNAIEMELRELERSLRRIWVQNGQGREA